MEKCHCAENGDLKEIIHSLQEIEKRVRGKEASAVETAIKSARTLLSGDSSGVLRQLDEELSTWQKKLNVILKEPVGREGMAKHMKYWIQELSKLGAGSSELGADKLGEKTKK